MGDVQPKLRELFFAALEQESQQELAAYLNTACGSDPELRSQVEHLLWAHGRAGRFLGGPSAEDDVPHENSPIAERPGARIGPYKLLEQIGEGGFGVVFMAEQTQPVRRKVALKVIKPGMDTEQVVVRFEAERQALAMMDHPNIARVLDAGATESRRPYFVMELVHGVPITEFCDVHRLTHPERLKLFIRVCRAVHHAHQKGVIHRDLKPSNIMVTRHDSEHVPKIIDFGVSKAISQPLTERTMFTAFGQVVGTPLYMSPEQAQLGGMDIDTRSDVYSLGVLLYELLTGTTPFDEATLKRVGFDEMRRMIREDEPVRPSTRVSTMKADLLSTVSDQRKIDPTKFGKSLRGELDWIVMKALEKDRNRRYESANSLAHDIECCLLNQPVEAGPPSAGYRLRKFARRHRAALTIAGMAISGLLVTVVGLGVATALIWRANNDARQALEHRRRLSYFQQVALAEREWLSNNLTRAEELIESCPRDLRAWEWHYVKRLRGPQIPRIRHENMVWDCAVSPDGTQIVSIDFTGRIYCWETGTGRPIRPHFRGHDADGAGYVVFSSDGSRFATSGWDDVRLWDSRTGERLQSWNAPAGTIQGLAFGPEGNLFACVCVRVGDWEVTTLWDALAGKQLFTVPDLNRIVQSIALSPDGELLALPCEDGTVRVLSSETGKPLHALRGTNKFWNAAFSPDGTLIAAASRNLEGERGSGTVRIWEVASGKERATLTGHGPMCVTFSPDSRRLVTGGTDQTVKVWDATSGEEILTLRGHSDFVRSVVFAPDGHRLISSSDDRTVRIWDGRPWNEGDRFGESSVTLYGHEDSVNAVAFHPREPLLVTGSADGTIKLWDARSWIEQRTVEVNLQRVDELDFSPNGEWLALIGNPSHSVLLVDARTFEERRLLENPSRAVPISVAFSPDGVLLAAGDDSGCVTVFDVATGSVANRFQTPSKFAYSVDFFPGAQRQLVAVAGVDGSIRIWDLARAREIEAPPMSHHGTLVGLAFSPDARVLASIGWDRAVRFWSTNDWTRSEVVIDATSTAQCIAFSPDSRFVAWGANDSSLKLWQRSTGEINSLPGHLGWILSVAFSPDGKLLASASEDGTAKIWVVPQEVSSKDHSAEPRGIDDVE